MPLVLLEESVRSILRTGVAIPSMTQCVRELVENSIDAGAKSITVRVDVGKYKIQVADNGEGVSKKDFGLVGQRYMTSKCHTISDLDSNLSHLGYRGEALASIISTAGTVEIQSRHRLSQQTYSKIFYHGKPGPVSPSSSPRDGCVGTTITIHDFFYNFPVRRKVISVVLELENMREMLQCLSLANPSVLFSLRDDATRELVMQTKRTSSLLGSFSSLFGTSKASCMRVVSSKCDNYAISGILSINSHYSKLLQFIFVNKRIIKKTPFHSCINGIVANSLIVRQLSRQPNPSKWRVQESTELSSPKKSSEKHAMYVLTIDCPRMEYDICLEPEKTLVEFKDWNKVLGMLTEMVRDFLLRHNLTLGVVCTEEEESDNYSTDSSHDSPTRPSSCDSPPKVEAVNRSLSCCQSHVEHVTHPIRRMGNVETSKGVIYSEPDIVVTKDSASHHRVGNSSCVIVPTSVLKPLPAILGLNEPVRSPLQSSSLSSKLACLLKCRDGKGALHATSKSHDTSSRDEEEDAEILKSAGNFSPSIAETAKRSPSLLHVPLQAVGKDIDSNKSSSLAESVAELAEEGASFVHSNGSSDIRCDRNTATSDEISARLSNTSNNYASKIQSSDSPWKVAYNPLGATKVYIHSRTGKTCTMVPGVESKLARDPLVGFASCSGAAKTCKTRRPSSEAGIESSRAPSLGRWYGAKPCDAAPHLSCDFDGLFPATKRMRLTGGMAWPVSRMAGSSVAESSVAGSSAAGSSVAGSSVAGSSVAGSSVARSSVAGFSVAGSSVAGSSVAGSSVAGSSVAGSSVAGSSVAGSSVAGSSVAGSSVAGSSVAGFSVAGSSVAGSSIAVSSAAVSSLKGSSAAGRSAVGSSTVWSSSMRSSSAVGGSTEGSSTVLSSVLGSSAVGGSAVESLSSMTCSSAVSSSAMGSFVASSSLVNSSVVVSGSSSMTYGTEQLDKGEKNTFEEVDSQSFETLLQSWKNPTFLAGQEDIVRLGSTSRNQVKVHNIINSYKFSKEMLSNVKVLGQVDKKFIACKVDAKGTGEHNLLVLFDQHAAHERVRLEALLSDLYEDCSWSESQLTIKCSQVQPPLLIQLTPAERRLSMHFRKELGALGVSLTYGEDGSMGVASLPSVLMEREVSERRRGRPAVALELVREMIIKHLEVLQTTSGGSQVMPTSLSHVLNSQACHSAIKFGDALSMDDCVDLIQSLSLCKLPFQCAHGRPSLVPILDLDILNRRYPYKTDCPTQLCKKLSSKLFQ